MMAMKPSTGRCGSTGGWSCGCARGDLDLHGLRARGCGPFGWRCPPTAEASAPSSSSSSGCVLVDTVRDPDKKEVMRVVEEEFLDRIRELDLPLHHRAARFSEVQELFDAGGIPLVLISSWRIYQERFPHWVVITGFEERFIYVHDPFVDVEQGQNVADCINMPVARSEFERMARYGRSGQRAVLVVWPRGEQRPTVTAEPRASAG
jgi:hypothetical protein